MKFHNIACIAALLLFLTVSCKTGAPSQSEFWKSVISNAQEGKVSSLVLVKCAEGSDAKLEYFVRASNGKFIFHSSCEGYIGRNGLGKTIEGDFKTPEGEFSLLKAFGILEDPGTELDYIDVTESIFACDENCEYYNQIIDTAVVHHACTGEDMSKLAPAYNYGAVINYNPERINPLGCNIFFHCKGNNPYTAGCVAGDEEFLRDFLQTCGKNPMISIHYL